MPVNGRLLRSQQVLVVPRRTFTGQHASAPVLPHAPAALPDLQAELLRTQAELNERETTFNVQRTQLEAALTRRSAEMDAALVTARAAAATVHAEAAAAMQEAQAEAAAALAAAAAQAVDLLELSAADARADGQALAQRLVLAAEDQVAAIRQSAQAAGFITGREEGRSVGEAGTQLVLLQAQRLIVEAEGWRASLLAASEGKLVDLLGIVAEQLFGKGYALDDQALQQMVRTAVQQAQHLSNLRVALHPADYERLLPLWPTPSVALIADAAVQAGGCVVHGDEGDVDFQVRRRLDGVQAALRETLGATAHDTD